MKRRGKKRKEKKEKERNVTSRLATYLAGSLHWKLHESVTI